MYLLYPVVHPCMAPKAKWSYTYESAEKELEPLIGKLCTVSGVWPGEARCGFKDQVQLEKTTLSPEIRASRYCWRGMEISCLRWVMIILRNSSKYRHRYLWYLLPRCSRVEVQYSRNGHNEVLKRSSVVKDSDIAENKIGINCTHDLW